MTNPPPLTDEWIKDMMFDHLAVCAVEPDKWKRVELFRQFGLQVKATIDHLKANQRTPGTVEMCQHFRSASCGDNEDYENLGACGRKSCPSRDGSTEKRT